MKKCLWLLCLPLLSSCGSGMIDSTMKVVTMGSNTRSRGDLTTIVASSTAYSYAIVDGMKLKVKQIRGNDQASDTPLSTLDFPAGDIVISSDPAQKVALNTKAGLKAGKYAGVTVVLDNAWEVKAYCKTRKNGAGGNGYLVYTSTSGVKAVGCDMTDCTSMPADYDYYKYTYLSRTDGISVLSSTTDETRQTSHLNFEINDKKDPIVSVLIDPSYAVACFDGSAWNEGEALTSFRGLTVDADRKAFYPDGKAQMSIGYLPIFAYPSTNPDEAEPTARTFMASGTIGDINPSASNFNWRRLEIVTMVYNSAGTVVIGSSRASKGAQDNTTPLDLDLEGFTPTADQVKLDFFASGWSDKGGPTKYIRNRQIFGFPKTPTDAFITLFQDADDCGQALTDSQEKNPSRPCMGGQANFHWREVVR